MESESRPPGGQPADNQPSNPPPPTPPPYPMPPQAPQPHGQRPYGQPYGQMPYGQQPYGQPGYPPPPPYAQPGPYGAPKRRDNNTIAIILGACGCAGLLGLVLVAAVLFPVFSQARNAAIRQTCLSNVKRQDLAFLMYVQDYDETMPPAPKWVDVCYPYLKDETALHCPTVRRENPTGFGYAFESRLSGAPVAVVEEPYSTAMLFESTNLKRGAADAGTTFANSPPRHSGASISGAHIGFLDGHAKLTSSYPYFKPLDSSFRSPR